MARRLRFFRKKRGDRVTGSQRLGRLGEALFHAVFFALGGVALALIILTMIVPQWRANYAYLQTTCRVLEVMPPEESRTEETVRFRPQVRIAYNVGGREYEAIAYDRLRAWYSDRARAASLSARFQTEQNYPCWYDPLQPEQVVLIRGAVWWVWLLAVLPAAFVVFGLAGLVRALLLSQSSRERRAALARPGAESERSELALGEVPRFPAVPGDADLRNSPGTALAYRLPIATTPSWQLFAAAMTCLFWNALVSVFVTIAVRNHLAGRPDWFLTVFCLPFVAIGAWLCYFFVRQFLMTTGIGATRIEISDHPLLPGREYELLLSQAGKLSVNSLELLLICDEQATYRQGTDTVADTQQVCRQQIFRTEGLQIQPGIPYEVRCRFRVPAGAMHSFKSDYNSVNWRLVVKGDIVRWPGYERDFPVVVQPRVDNGAGLGDVAAAAARPAVAPAREDVA